MQTRAGLEKEDASGGRRTRIKERRSSLSSGGARAAGEVMWRALSISRALQYGGVWEVGNRGCDRKLREDVISHLWVEG